MKTLFTRPLEGLRTLPLNALSCRQLRSEERWSWRNPGWSRTTTGGSSMLWFRRYVDSCEFTREGVETKSCVIVLSSVWRHNTHTHWIPGTLQRPFPAQLQRASVQGSSLSQTVSLLHNNIFSGHNICTKRQGFQTWPLIIKYEKWLKLA